MDWVHQSWTNVSFTYKAALQKTVVSLFSSIQFHVTYRGTMYFFKLISNVFFSSDGPVFPLSTYCVARLRPRRDATDTPWWRLTVNCMCLEGRQTTLYPMNCTLMMWTLRHGRSFSPAQTARYDRIRRSLTPANIITTNLFIQLSRFKSWRSVRVFLMDYFYSAISLWIKLIRH